jgi:hypothetical protein
MAKRPEIAGPDEDPNVTIECSSPPCFMHELEPHPDPKDGDAKKKRRRPNRIPPKP